MMEIHLDSLNRAHYDGFNETLTLDLGNGVNIRVTDYALTVLRDAMPGGSDLSDLESAIGELREKLESAQSGITSALEDAERNIADAQSRIEDAQSEAGCHGDAADALSALESAFNEINS